MVWPKGKGTKTKGADKKHVRQRVTITNKNLNQFVPLNITSIMADNYICQQVKLSDDQPPTLKSALKINVPTSNHFGALEEPEIMESQATVANNPPNTQNQTTSGKKTSKPPAIVLHHKIGDHSSWFNTMDVHVKNGYYIKNSKNNTNIFINNHEEYKNYKEILEKEDISFDSYTVKEEKPHSFVIKGIDSSPSDEEIKQDLEVKYNLNIKNVFKLKTKGTNLYVVQTDNTIHLKYLINNVRFVCHTKIRWERFNKQDPWVQCRRCQRLGHSTTNCRADPKCVKCGQGHWSKNCTNVFKDNPETHIHVKCANCHGGHVAFSKDGPVIQRRQKLTETIKNTRVDKLNTKGPAVMNRTNYVDAPVPRVNVWAQPTSSTQRTPTVRANDCMMDGDMAAANNFNSLVSEFNMLNNLIDINKMLQLVREINRLLANCKDNLEKFVTLNNFCQKNFKATINHPSASP